MLRPISLFIFAGFLLTACGPSPVADTPLDTNINTMNETLLQLKVNGYENDGRMPERFATIAGGGENKSPGLTWQPLPAAQSYAVMMDDKHPVANHWVHWLVADIPNFVTEIAEGASRTDMPEGSRELTTSWGKTGYDGPQPPVGSGDHEYVIHLYALDIPKLSLTENTTRSDFLKALQGHVIAEETYSGWFERK